MSAQPDFIVGDCIKQVVKFARELDIKEIPQAVVSDTKLILLDAIGAMLAASDVKHEAGQILTEFVKSQGGVEESTIIGRGFKSSAINTAIINGTFGYYCDIEAHHPEAVVHPAATIVPTALAINEREKKSGAELLVSFILGAEFDCRVSLALNPRVLYDQGFHPSSIAGTVGATVAAARALDLSVDQFYVALGLAGQQTSGLLAWKEDFTENARPFNHGISARNGITSAMLAKLGFGAPPDLFEGRYNIFRAFGKGDMKNLPALTEKLGDHYAISQLAYKQYSCCAFTHPGLDALINIMQEYRLKSEDIENITLRFPKNGTELIDGTDLLSHSAQYVLSVGAVDGRVMIDDILYDRRSEPEIKRLVDRTTIVGDDVLDAEYPEKYASIIELKTVKGAEYTKRVDYAAGTPENPLSPEEIKRKFFKLVEPIVDDSRAQKIAAYIETIDHQEDISGLSALLMDAKNV